jgi:hypothetical protein
VAEGAAPLMSGYSGTPLAKKLGLRANSRVCLYAAPENYRQLLAPLPEGVRMSARLGTDTDVIHAFVHERAVLAPLLRRLRRAMPAHAALWVSWPKKASGAPTDLSEDVIRALALPLGLVDIKVCAVDELWSGLKLMIRREQRSAPPPPRAARAAARGARRA